MINNRFENQKLLPQPRPGKAGAWKVMLLAVISTIALGGTAFWLHMAPDKKADFRDQAADYINKSLSDTPLSGLGEALRTPPPPIPSHVINPPTAQGTLAGRIVQGTIGSDDQSQLEASNDKNKDDKQRKPNFSSNPLPPVTEDSKVKVDFLMDIANWLVSRYKPGNGGNLSFTPQILNSVCGVTIAGKAQGGRAALFNYAFNSNMLQGLYDLYIDRFMFDLNEAAAKHGLDATQNKNFHHAIAGKSALLSQAIVDILKTQGLKESIRQIDAYSQKSIEINAQLTNAVFELDEMRAAKASKQQITALQMRVDGISARYRRSVDELENSRRSLVSTIRKNSGISLDDASLLYIASWIERRLNAGSSSETIYKCAEILHDLAKRCQEF